MNTTTPIIKTSGLTRDFKSLRAVDALDLAIQPDELFGLVGPDGAGKTTTLRLLAGLLFITEGSATVAGFDLGSQADAIKPHIGYMAQQFSLYAELSVLENLHFFAALYDVSRTERRERTERLLEFAGLTEFTTRRAGHLSGGMQKKLALACTLIHEPEIILLDEPTTGVDPISRREFWNILTDLHLRGTTILVSTPYMDEADRCSRIGLMYAGKMIAVDTPRNIRSRVQGDLIQIYPQDQQAASAELDSARADYKTELTNLNELLDDPANAELLDAELRLAEARVAFDIAQTLRDRAIKQSDGKEPLDDYIQTLYDAAESELESAQLNYDQLLTEQEYEDVLEARARVSAARQRYEIALDYLDSLQTGENDPSLKVAEAAIVQAQAMLTQAQAAQVQAEAALTQAEKAVEQTQAALEMAQIQLDKLSVYAPIDGVVLTCNLEVGELARPGGTALTLGLLDDLTVKVYIPESQYGSIRLGDAATLTANSFPDETFAATVIRIADKAEYTPRNVQTSEDRAATVYAVDLSVDDPQSPLKPGMPVDVRFEK